MIICLINVQSSQVAKYIIYLIVNVLYSNIKYSLDEAEILDDDKGDSWFCIPPECRA